MADSKQLYWGAVHPVTVGAPAFITFTLNGSTDKFSVVFMPLFDITVTRLYVKITTITNDVTWTLGLQGVDASGNEDGTYLTSGTAKVDFSPTSLGWASGEGHWVNLDASASLSRGVLYAYNFQYSSGTLGSQVVHTSLTQPNRQGLPYAIANDAGSRSRSSSPPCFGYGSSGTAYGNPLETLSELSYGSTSTPDEWSMVFTYPTHLASTFKIAAVRPHDARPAAGGTTKVILYDTDGTTVLQDVTFDHDAVYDNLNNSAPTIAFDETTLATLTAGGTYRIGFQPQSATTWKMYAWDVDDVADWEAWPGGQLLSTASRSDAGSWTPLLTRRFNCDLIIVDVTQAAGGSGGLILPRYLGGGLV